MSLLISASFDQACSSIDFLGLEDGEDSFPMFPFASGRKSKATGEYCNGNNGSSGVGGRATVVPGTERHPHAAAN